MLLSKFWNMPLSVENWIIFSIVNAIAILISARFIAPKRWCKYEWRAACQFFGGIAVLGPIGTVVLFLVSCFGIAYFIPRLLMKAVKVMLPGITGIDRKLAALLGITLKGRS